VTTPTASRPVLWKRRDVRIAWAAGFVNNTGDWILLVALPVYVFVETRSGASTAFLFVAQLIAGAVFGPIGGSLVDRWNLKASLVGTNIAQAITVLPLLAVNADRIWPAYIVMAAQSALNQINNPANVALVPRVVRRDELTAANAGLAAAESTARLIGAPLGGLLVAWGGLTPIVLLDAISFAFVAAAIPFLRSDTSPHPDDTNPRTVREGLRVVRSHHPLAPLLSIQSGAQIAQGAFVILFVVFVVNTLGDDGIGLGIIRGTMAIGALAGSVIISRLARAIDPTTLFAAGLLGMGATSLLFWNASAVTTDIWVYVILFSLSGLPGAALSIGLFTTLQATSPPHAIGRVTGIMTAGEAIGITIGSIAAGIAVDHIRLDALLDAQAAIYLAAGVLAWLLVMPNPKHHAAAPVRELQQAPTTADQPLERS
jgi:predicted MFS family arabinose efflux permease